MEAQHQEPLRGLRALVKAMSAQVIVPAPFRLAIERTLHAKIQRAARASSMIANPALLPLLVAHFTQAHFAADQCDIIEVNRILDAAGKFVPIERARRSG